MGYSDLWRCENCGTEDQRDWHTECAVCGAPRPGYWADDETPPPADVDAESAGDPFNYEGPPEDMSEFFWSVILGEA
jgi:hypothetical protein